MAPFRKRALFCFLFVLLFASSFKKEEKRERKRNKKGAKKGYCEQPYSILGIGLNTKITSVHGLESRIRNSDESAGKEGYDNRRCVMKLAPNRLLREEGKMVHWARESLRVDAWWHCEGKT
ncbi:hypothetical protein B0H17DRAFT_1302536 [Mycena rosella]|uniref:Secreted protein n=1 Tax=Mycena rosella TaxID=1033263 RepID=A0AAD7DC23_MYCRO|nr:hypothetical protein B0H17DRAFT_1302536 [Mycena rosella]